MTSFNDLLLSEALTAIEKMQRRASDALGRGDQNDAFIAFMLIEASANSAMIRLNALKYASGVTVKEVRP